MNYKEDIKREKKYMNKIKKKRQTIFIKEKITNQVRQTKNKKWSKYIRWREYELLQLPFYVSNKINLIR